MLLKCEATVGKLIQGPVVVVTGHFLLTILYLMVSCQYKSAMCGR